jgi:hypothetical protein
MNIPKKCEQIWSLLGDLSSTGIKPIPDLVYRMRVLLSKIEEANLKYENDNGFKCHCGRPDKAANGRCFNCGNVLE